MTPTTAYEPGTIVAAYAYGSARRTRRLTVQIISDESAMLRPGVVWAVRVTVDTDGAVVHGRNLPHLYVVAE